MSENDSPLMLKRPAGTAPAYADAGALTGTKGLRGRSGNRPENEKAAPKRGFREAAEGIRTLDLLHGKQTL